MGRHIQIDVSGMWYFQDVDIHHLTEEEVISIVREDISLDPWRLDIEVTHIDESKPLSQ